jgi:hypothetical protein
MSDQRIPENPTGVFSNSGVFLKPQIISISIYQQNKNISTPFLTFFVNITSFMYLLKTRQSSKK